MGHLNICTVHAQWYALKACAKCTHTQIPDREIHLTGTERHNCTVIYNNRCEWQIPELENKQAPDVTLNPFMINTKKQWHASGVTSWWTAWVCHDRWDVNYSKIHRSTLLCGALPTHSYTHQIHNHAYTYRCCSTDARAWCLVYSVFCFNFVVMPTKNTTVI